MVVNDERQCLLDDGIGSITTSEMTSWFSSSNADAAGDDKVDDGGSDDGGDSDLFGVGSDDEVAGDVLSDSSIGASKC